MKRRDVNRVYGLPWTLRLRFWPQRRRYERARRAAERDRERVVRELLEQQQQIVVAEVLDREGLRRIAEGIDPIPRITPPLDDPDGGMRAD